MSSYKLEALRKARSLTLAAALVLAPTRISDSMTLPMQLPHVPEGKTYAILVNGLDNQCFRRATGQIMQTLTTLGVPHEQIFVLDAGLPTKAPIETLEQLASSLSATLGPADLLITSIISHGNRSYGTVSQRPLSYVRIGPDKLYETQLRRMLEPIKAVKVTTTDACQTGGFATHTADVPLSFTLATSRAFEKSKCDARGTYASKFYEALHPLNRSKADQDGDGLVSVAEQHSYAMEQHAPVRNGHHRPVYSGSLDPRSVFVGPAGIQIPSPKGEKRTY